MINLFLSASQSLEAIELCHNVRSKSGAYGCLQTGKIDAKIDQVLIFPNLESLSLRLDDSFVINIIASARFVEVSYLSLAFGTISKGAISILSFTSHSLTTLHLGGCTEQKEGRDHKGRGITFLILKRLEIQIAPCQPAGSSFKHADTPKFQNLPSNAGIPQPTLPKYLSTKF